MNLLSTIEDFQKYVKINKTINFENLSPFLSDAENKFIIPNISRAVYDKLIEAMDPDEGEPAGEGEGKTYADLLPYVQAAVARFTMFLAAPSLDINIGETGFTVASNSNFAPASSQRVDKLIASIEQLGWDSMEDVFRFLEENKDDFDEWTSSDEYTLAIRNIINSAVLFDKYVDISKSRLLFKNLRYNMDNVEAMTIKPAISSALFDEILEQIESGEISSANTAILENLRRACANLSYADFLENQPTKVYSVVDGKNSDSKVRQSSIDKYNRVGLNFLTAVKKAMDASPTSYPLYAASDSYIATRENYSGFVSDPSDKIISLGGMMQ